MKKVFYLFTFVVLFGTNFNSCTYTAERTERGAVGTLTRSNDFVGTFVSEGYEQRTSGADWISVTIIQIRENLFHIEVRSRSDIKKPTCTLTTDAHINKKGELSASQSGLDLGFRISGDFLNIYSPSNNYLGYFCSGGATLTGKYKRIPGEPDQKQVDHSQFSKFLELQNFTFSVEAVHDILTIQPTFPESSKNQVKLPFKGSVSNAEIADLDTDGLPEIYIYFREGKDQHLRLKAYYLDKGAGLQKIKSSGRLPLQPEEAKNYHGKDEYKVNEEEEVLLQLIPIRGTNNFHYVQYTLKKENGIPELVLRSVSTTNVVVSLWSNSPDWGINPHFPTRWHNSLLPFILNKSFIKH